MGNWESEASNWIRWARTPGHDSYWYYRDAFFSGTCPAPGRLTLDLCCGEGRVARDLAERGHPVIGVDLSPTLISAAREADPGGRYVLADASALPFLDATFDLVVAYNSLMDVDDLDGTVAEASRILEGGGRLAISITHPTTEAGRFADREPDAPFVISGSYLDPQRRAEGTFERDGLVMTFRHRCYPLEVYAEALRRAGFVIERLREPAAGDEALRVYGPSEIRWTRVPLFLHVLARKDALTPSLDRRIA